MHICARFCTFLYIIACFCTWDIPTPPIKYWPSTARIFILEHSITYHWPYVWYRILSCMSFSILQKTCITRPYCRGEGMPKILMGKYLCDWLYHLTEISSGRGCSRHKTTAKNFRLSEEHKSSLNSELFIMNLTNFE